MRITEEDKIQANIVKAVRLCHPKSLIFSVPNGGYRHQTTASILKYTGLMPGVSDLIWLYKNKIIFVEVKTDKGKQSEHQKAFQDKIIAMGFNYWIVRSADEMLKRIEDYIYSAC